jgi:hypothetical protein
MLTLQEFINLDLDNKIHYLSGILHPIVKDDKDWEKNLEIFLFGSSDKDLVEFYEILLDPEKTNSYIDKRWKDLKEWNLKVENLSNLLYRAKIEMEEWLAQEDADEILNQI